jgi:hypothetical protein
MTIDIVTPASLSVPGTIDRRDRQEYPPRPRPQTWPETQQTRAGLAERLSNPPFRSDSADVRGCMRRGLAALLDWLERQPGLTWQERWLASGAEADGRTWTDLVRHDAPSLASRPAGNVHTDLLTATRLMLTGQVLRPGYAWLLRYRPSVLLQEARDRLDPAGFARLVAHCEATGRRNPQDRTEALNRITWILLHKGGLIRDITIGDCIEISNALQEHQCQGANNRPLFYALLAETGVLPAGAPPMLRATRMAGQRTPAELAGKYGLQSQPVRDLLTAYLAERAAELDYASLVGMARTLCGLFWRDLEQHHPGIASLHLHPEVAAAWKQRLRQVRDQDGRLIGDRATARSQLLIVRAFYLDPHPARWSTFTARSCSAETRSRAGSMSPTWPPAGDATSPSKKNAPSGDGRPSRFSGPQASASRNWSSCRTTVSSPTSSPAPARSSRCSRSPRPRLTQKDCCWYRRSSERSSPRSSTASGAAGRRCR